MWAVTVSRHMVSARTIHYGLNNVAFLALYSLVANWLGGALSLGTIAGAVVALAISLGVFAALDVVKARLRSDSADASTFGEGSRLYAVRGLLVLYLFFLVTAGAAEVLRATTGLSDTVVVLSGALVAAVVVFGPLVGYYYRRSLDAAPA